MNVGLVLKVKQHKLDCIDADYRYVERKAFHMLLKWKDTNPHPCYCELLTALREQDLHEAVKRLEEFIVKKS